MADGDALSFEDAQTDPAVPVANAGAPLAFEDAQDTPPPAPPPDLSGGLYGHDTAPLPAGYGAPPTRAPLAEPFMALPSSADANTQMEAVQKRLSAQGMSDADIQNNPEWQASARTLGHAVNQEGTQQAGLAAGSLMGAGPGALFKSLVGSEVASKGNKKLSADGTGVIPDGLARFIGGFSPIPAEALVSGTKAALPAVTSIAKAIVSPYKSSATNATGYLKSLDNTGAPLKPPSVDDVTAQTGAVKSATDDMTEGGAPDFMAGGKIQSDLIARQTALKQARTDATEPLAAARDASTNPINTDPVIATINSKLRTAGGDQAKALNGALDDLKYPSGVLKTDAGGLKGARDAINTRISTAKSAGDNATVKHLSDVRNALDAQVAAVVPEAGQATAAYEAGSKPLDVFQPGKSPVDAVPNIVARDNFGNLNGTNPSQIPDTFLRGGGTKEKLDQLVQAYGGDKDAAEAALQSHLAEVAKGAVNPDGTLDAGKFAQVMKPYQKVIGLDTRPPAPPAPGETLGMTPPAENPQLSRLQELTRDSSLADAGERAAGSPSRSFASIAAEPAPSVPATATTRNNLGNTGVWFPKLQAKFATAQSAQGTLDTMNAAKSVGDSIANHEMRGPDGALTGTSFNGWLAANKANVLKAQGPGAVMRLQQLGKVLKGVSPGDTDAAADVIASSVGAVTGGAEGGVFGHLLSNSFVKPLLKPWGNATKSGFADVIERAVKDPSYAKTIVSQLPTKNAGALDILRAAAKSAGRATTPPRLITGPSQDTSQRQ
jgi:hypothetical protein